MSSANSSSLVGKRLGPYRIQAVLGSGGMGDVYRAVHEKLGRLVAIKTLKPDIAADGTALDRFIKEARAVNAIRHENIVEVTDFAPDGFKPHYMVMELLEGQTLTTAIRDAARIPLQRSARIGAQMASAIHAAHALDIVHRDLKPDNVFLIRRAGTHDYVKILDFGIARLRRPPGDATATKSNVLIGTPLYMSPEQAEGVPATAASDIYTLGVILFQMLTGQLPFKCDSMLEVMYAHLKLTPPKVSELSPEVPAPIASLIARMLAKKPGDRPVDMRAVGTELVAAVGLSPEQFGLHETAGPITPLPAPLSASRGSRPSTGTLDERPADRPAEQSVEPSGVRASSNPVDSVADSMWAGATVDTTGTRRRLASENAATEQPADAASADRAGPVPVPIPERTTSKQRPAALAAQAPARPPADLGSTRSEIMAAVSPPLPPGGTERKPLVRARAENTPASADPSAADPSAASPSAADPSAADPSAASPSAADPSAADPSAASSQQALDRTEDVDLGSMDTIAPALVQSANRDMNAVGVDGERRSAVVAAVPTPMPTRPARPRATGTANNRKIAVIVSGLVIALVAGVVLVLAQGNRASESVAGADSDGQSHSIRNGDGGDGQRPEQTATSEENAQLLRQRLDAVIAVYDEPGAPDPCHTSEPQLLMRLAQAAGELAGGAPDGKRARDTKAEASLSAHSADAAEYWYWLGKARLYTGAARERVIDAGERAVARCDSYAAAHALIGTAKFQAGDTSGAELAYKRALSLADDFQNARYNLALTQLRLKRLDEGIALLTRVIEERARVPEARLARGQAYLQQGKSDPALADLEAATAALPESAKGFYALGNAYRRAGRTADGQAALCRAAQLGHKKAAQLCAQP